MTDSTLPALHHVQHGPADGTPVLVLHGFPVDHRLMTGFCEPVFTARSAGYRRLYPDLPGMGRTPVGRVASSDDVLASVQAFIDEQIGSTPFVLVGESYGGYLARALANLRCEQVLGLALVCPIGRAVQHADRNVPAHQVLVRDIDVDPESAFGQIAVVATQLTYDRTQREVMPGLEDADQAAVQRIRERWVLEREPEMGDTFDNPTLVITGRQDSSVGYLDVWALLDHYPRATFAVLDTAGHNVQIERREAVGSLLHDWLDRCELAPTAQANG